MTLRQIEEITGYAFKYRNLAGGQPRYITEEDKGGLWIESIGPEDNPKSLSLWLFPQDDELKRIDDIAKFHHCLDKVASGWRDDKEWPTKSLDAARTGLTVIQQVGRIEIRVRYFDLLKGYLFKIRPLRTEARNH